VPKRKLLAQNQVVDDSEHQDEIEFTGEAIEQRELFAITPSGRRSGTRDIGNDCRDRFALTSCCSPERLERCSIGVDCDDAGSCICCNQRVGSSVGADVENAGGTAALRDIPDEFLFVRRIGGLIVLRRLRVFAPLAATL